MSCTASHSIDLSNLATGNHVSHSIVLVKGKVKNCDSFDEQITIHNANTDETFRSSEMKKANGAVSFKCLVQLEVGENVLTLKFCQIKSAFILHYDEPDQPKYILKLYYVICRGHDGNFQSGANAENSADSACERITLAVQLIQCLIAEKFCEAGFERKTFQFIKCKKFHSSLPIEVARTWNASQLWNYHAKEMLAFETEKDRHIKYASILAGTIYENGKLLANAALGAGDAAVYGSGCLYAWPSTVHEVIDCFRNGHLVDRSMLLDDSNGRRTYGGCFATTLGSLCHEIGHIFDLGHTNDGIMGTGFDLINRFFTIETQTTILPLRKIASCKPAIDGNAIALDMRLTKVRKANRFLKEYHSQRDSNDLTYFRDNCNAMLFYHKWFNQPDNVIPHEIQFNRMSSKILSTLPLRLVEFRDKLNGMCLEHRTFNDHDEFEYLLPFHDNNCDFDILVLDSQGNLARF